MSNKLEEMCRLNEECQGANRIVREINRTVQLRIWVITGAVFMLLLLCPYDFLNIGVIVHKAYLAGAIYLTAMSVLVLPLSVKMRKHYHIVSATAEQIEQLAD